MFADPACTTTKPAPDLIGRDLHAEHLGTKSVCDIGTRAWEEFTPFLRFDTEIRRIVCTTNAIESVNARSRRAVKARGHLPNEQAALKRVYKAIMPRDLTGKDRAMAVRSTCPQCRRRCYFCLKRAILHPSQHTTSAIKGLLPARTTLYAAALGQTSGLDQDTGRISAADEKNGERT